VRPQLFRADSAPGAAVHRRPWAEARHTQLLPKCHQRIYNQHLSQTPRHLARLLLPQLGLGGEHTAAVSGLSQDLVQRQRVDAAPQQITADAEAVLEALSCLLRWGHDRGGVMASPPLVQANPKDCRSEAWIRSTTSLASNPLVALLGCTSSRKAGLLTLRHTSKPSSTSTSGLASRRLARP